MKKTPRDLFKLAKKAQKHSYSPYSHYPVGCVVVTDRGTFLGTNVENASYGGTICAERSAIFTACSNGARKIKQIAIITKNSAPKFPCGMCLQVIQEFSDKFTEIYSFGKTGKCRLLKLSDLLPLNFNASDLKG